MRAVVMRRFGPPEVLAIDEVPMPEPGEGQVVVHVAYTGITFVETQIRAGRPPNPAMLPPLPAVLGNGVGGTVSEVGAGVDPGLVGRRVVTGTGGSGGYAEQAVAAADHLVAVPDDVDLADALAVLADGRTAMLLTRSASLGPGQSVLVTAAGGGVGTLLVQLARDAGAEVIAAAGDRRKLDLARDLGADVAIDYRQPDWAKKLRSTAGSLDVVFDAVGGTIGREAWDLVAEEGRFVPFGMASGSFTGVDADEAATRRVAVVRPPRPSPAESADLARGAVDGVRNGRLRPIIGQRFPLADAATAHTAIEARATIGKSLLVVDRTGAR